MNKRKISQLHVITAELPGRDHATVAELACKGGADWIQLRIKDKKEAEVAVIARQVKAICDKYHAVLIINDHVRLAQAIGAHGVHLGKEDMHPVEARRILGPEAIIGASTNSEEDILLQNSLPVDYIGLGPLRFTRTREKLNPVLGAERLVRLARIATVPVIAIGGITMEDVFFLRRRGLHGVAVASAIASAQNPVAATAEFLAECQMKEAML
ncbi:MAG: thiamine phosphate synthase [Bacteroidia bacterium]|nr:thiamine phosphate synthase [Bacteroidia bacterium]